MNNGSVSYTDNHAETMGSPTDTVDLEQFIADLYQNSRPIYASFSFTSDAIDPLAYLEMCWKNDTFQYYWEKPSDQFAMAAGGELVTVSASGESRFQEINTKIESLKKSTAEFSSIGHPYSGMMFLGGFSFYDEISDKMWDSFEPATFTVPEWMIVKDGKFSLITISVNLESFDSPQKLHNYVQTKFERISSAIKDYPGQKIQDKNQPTPTPPMESNGKSAHHHWVSSVNKAKNLISQNKFDKIVLARHISISNDKNIGPTQVLNVLRQQYTNCYNFLIHHPNNKTFLGSTPERLGAFRNNLLLTDALAGSIQRGKTATEDTILERSLSGSLKDRNEHNFVIKDIEERLEPFVESVNRSTQPEVKKLTNVQHLYTPIRARMKKECNMLGVLGHLHPTPAVGGYPWKNAESYLKQLEGFERGWYAGPVGWLNSKGSGEFAVGIRSSLLTEKEAHFFAGCGIVAGSDPEAEWEEINLKLKPMLSALQYD